MFVPLCGIETGHAIVSDRRVNGRMAREKAPGLMASHGISTMTVAEMLILGGDNSERIISEAVLAKLCGVCPVPASSGKTNRMRLNRGGNRQANAALYRVAIVRMRDHEMTRPTWRKEQRKEKHAGKLSDALNDTLYAKSTIIFVEHKHHYAQFDKYRNIKAVAEKFFSSLKHERIWRRTYKTRQEARQDVFDYIEMFYNPVPQAGQKRDAVTRAVRTTADFECSRRPEN